MTGNEIEFFDRLERVPRISDIPVAVLIERASRESAAPHANRSPVAWAGAQSIAIQ
ncbi:hypothetical protein LJ655_26065 [Paraburkholderia sp. MMS20-SJTN17]|uniref:Uncharacterized protein n=1 Tax=Paraburkholderia translucens TaxID=2886945 RepID=A0ABS8KKN2_9BURK|nr:hypothetical protein [Paraburkholderia sp. MMS20-SJTN17]MCC8405287.1 hypothetical protein [Paraburkholderia sp. MMS20-SJTN17]